MLEHFYQLGIQPDWWKLPPLSSASWEKIAGLIAREDPGVAGSCCWASRRQIDCAPGLPSRRHPIIKGFAVGRTIFGQPSRRWMAGELSDGALIGEVKQNYLRLIDYWRSPRLTPR